MKLLSYDAFKQFDASTALSIIEAISRSQAKDGVVPPSEISSEELSTLISPFDMKRLESYAESMIDYHVVLDLIPTLATLFFTSRLGPDCTLSPAQRAILLALGLQRKSVEVMERELGLTSSQALALFGKILRRITNQLNVIRKAEAGEDLPMDGPEASTASASRRRPLEETIEEELAEGVDVNGVDQNEQREELSAMDLSQSALL